MLICSLVQLYMFFFICLFSEPLNIQTTLKSPIMPSSPDRMLPGELTGSSKKDSGYTMVQVDSRLPNNVLPSQAIFPVSSNAHLIPSHMDNQCRPNTRPNNFHGFSYKNGNANSDEFLDNRSRRSSGLYMGKRSGHCSIKWSNLFFIITTIISFVLIGFLFYTVVQLQSRCESLETKLNYKIEAAPMKQEEPKLCLPCEELSLGPFDEDTPGLKELFRKEENGKTVCCAQSTAQHSILLNLVSIN